MKKSVIAIVAAAAVAALGLPVFSGCSASVGYVLKKDGDGNSYYSVAVSGSKLAMDGEVVIPPEYEGLPVKEIEANAFSNTTVSKVTIPASVETIGAAAFAYNNALREVVFEEGAVIDEIAWGMFANCSHLEKINIPDSVKVIDGLSFYGCSGLAGIGFPAGLEKINMAAFQDCVGLTELELPQKLISIGGMAFYGCTSLKSVILPDSMHPVTSPKLDSDGNEVKDDKGQTITETTPALGVISFFGCSSLELAVIGSGITTIEAGTFGNCSSLAEIYLPVSLNAVGGMYSAGTTLYGHAFYNVSHLTVHYAGTAEQWNVLKNNIDSSSVSYRDAISDNSALLNAEVVYESAYPG